jgi:catechol 2,3-dioxygenase-like lactoylglutathione lyase family enzyme
MQQDEIPEIGKKRVLKVPVTAKERGKVSPAQMAHIVFKTPNLSKMVDWWCALLEAEASMYTGELAFLTYDDEHHRVALIGMPALLPQIKATRGMDHVAFTYYSLSDLCHTYLRLKQFGIKPHWSINHGPTTSIYYHDPDNNQVELQVENFDNAEMLSDWLQGDEFIINPIGVDFEPDQLCEDLANGVAEVTLKKRGNIGKRGIDSVPKAVIGNLHKVLTKLKPD